MTDLFDQPREGEPIWEPTAEHLDRSRLLDFIEEHDLDSYEALLEQADRDPAWYWNAVVDHLGLEWFRRYDEVLNLERGVPWPKWFVNGRYNYVHDAVDKHASGPNANKTAILWEGDGGDVRQFTFAELAAETDRVAAGLRSLGVEKGDAVGIFMPMLPETAIATLACSKIGAIFAPIFSGYGAEAVANRLRDCDAKILFTADGFYRRGKEIPMKPTADTAVKLVESVQHVVTFQHTRGDIAWFEPRDVWWKELSGDAVETEPTSSDDPYMIIYTSGTTGRPKGAVHIHSGFPIKAAHDLAFCFDLQQDDTLLWITDLGWMMGPWAIQGTLINGATLAMFEGTPDYPNPDRMWELTAKHRVSILGVSPTAIRALMNQGDDWPRRHDLSSLRVFGSTGEPWNPWPWLWLFDVVGERRCPIINYSGGTEISGGIVGCVTIKPQKPCAFTGPVPGMNVDVLNEAGEPVRGEVGELVVKHPWVGMTNGFWKDPDRYLETYWSRFPDTWVHGDWALVDEDGFWYILGRSDDTIKTAGKRVGPAEVESAAVAHPSVQEAAAIGVPDELKGEKVIVFAVLGGGNKESDPVRDEIRDLITDHLGRPLRPDAVYFVDDLPKTRNAKIMRRVIKSTYLKQDAGDLSALENPASVDGIRRAR